MTVNKAESMNLVENVRREIRAAGLTMTSVEKSCGLCPGFLTRSLNTGCGVSLSTAIALSRAVGKPIDSLILEPIKAAQTPEERDKQLVQIDMEISNLTSRLAGLHLRRAELLSKN